MTRTTTLLSALSLVIALATSGCKGDIDTSGAVGTLSNTNGAKAKLWKALGKHQRVWLKNWRGAFADGAPSDQDVIDAWGEIAYASTGPAGFWRHKVPNMWLGCAKDKSSASCRALSAASGEFERWDRFQEKLENLRDGQAARFLKKNGAKMLGYLRTFVPTKQSASAMERTGFYKKHLRKAMAEAGGVAADDDL